MLCGVQDKSKISKPSERQSSLVISFRTSLRYLLGEEIILLFGFPHVKRIYFIGNWAEITNLFSHGHYPHKKLRSDQAWPSSSNVWLKDLCLWSIYWKLSIYKLETVLERRKASHKGLLGEKKCSLLVIGRSAVILRSVLIAFEEYV